MSNSRYLNIGTRIESLLDVLGKLEVRLAHVGQLEVVLLLTLVVEDGEVTLRIDVNELKVLLDRDIRNGGGEGGTRPGQGEF